jgi:cell division protein FtsB
MNLQIDPEAGMGAVAGLASVWLVFKKLLVKSKREDVNLQAEGAQMDVITLMRSEIRRLSDGNKELVDTINNFVRITRELTAAMNEMERENDQLKLEVKRLNCALIEFKEKLETIRTRKNDVPFTLKNDDRRTN